MRGYAKQSYTVQIKIRDTSSVGLKKRHTYKKTASTITRKQQNVWNHHSSCSPQYYKI